MIQVGWVLVPVWRCVFAVRSELLRAASLVAAALLVLPSMQAQGVLINEIMYHPPGTNRLDQWFELYNPGPTPVVLDGWRVKGDVDFTFPAASALPAGGYLVVAADLATFTTRYPAVTNVVAGWQGELRHHLRIEEAGGATVNAVDFYSEGDWAVRVLGAPTYNHRGWGWFAEHDGLGKSLELVNPALPNDQPANWTSSTISGGTPGRANATARADSAPFISSVSHRPVLPHPTDPVTVNARVLDEDLATTVVTLRWRVDGATSYGSIAMADDGAHGDGVAGDGIYGAIVSPHARGTVIEFYVEARDAAGNHRAYPAFVPPPNSTRTANLLYQVDDGVYAGAQPVYRIIMREEERAELYNLGRAFPDADSDAEMNATWITSDGVLDNGTTIQARYNVGVRNRGHGTRTANPNNYHVNIPGDRAWKGLAGINLNSHYAYSQVIGSAIFRRLGVPMADSRPVQVRVNSTNLMATVGSTSFGSYAANEQYNDDFVKRSWPTDPEGNSYRGIRGPTNDGPQPEADLSWQGANFFATGSYTNAYFKQNNFLANDYSDLIRLIGVLNLQPGYANAANYVEKVREVVDVEEWMRYMAINTLLDNNETCLANGVGDDYALYRGTNDTRFLVLPYDLDTVLARGLTATSTGHSIWRMNDLPVMDRFMKTPEFAPRYFHWLKWLADTAFSPAQLNPLLDQLLQGYVPQATIDTMKAFNSNQVASVLAQVPLELTVPLNLPIQSGYPRVTVAAIPLHGTANAIDTRRILVNGVATPWSAWQGAWTNTSVALHPGINRVLIQALGEQDVEVGRMSVDIWYDDGSVASVGGVITANTTWTAAGGPYQITSSLTVNPGVTLAIQPGTTVYLGSGVNVTVANGGRLLAEGTAAAPVRFTVAPGSSASWGGFTIDGGAGSPETRIAYAHFEGNGTTCLEVAGGTVALDHLTFGTTTHQYLALDGSSFVVSHCVFPSGSSGFELVHGTGGIKAGGRGIVRDCFFGATTGYNDVMDFTGGNRDQGQPIIQYYNNVFIGSGDDELDLDGTDAWIEGNIFLHVHRNGAPDSSAAVSGGNTGGDTSEITMVGNLFYDCDNAVTAKQGNFYTLLNNTIVHITKQGGVDFASGVVNLRDTTPDVTTLARGAYVEGNIIVDAESLLRNYDPTQSTVTITNNLMPFTWTGPGGGNSTADPLLVHVPVLDETHFTTWEEAQVMRHWLSLRPGSPAFGTGPGGRDRGGIIPMGATLSGAPQGTTAADEVSLAVGENRKGHGLPTAGFPLGSGFTHYRWRLDGGTWSGETAIAAPITLTHLAQGPHQVEVAGRNDAGFYQDDAQLGTNAVVTSSPVWIVDTNHVAPPPAGLRLNEVLAQNVATLTVNGTTPDLIELHNAGATPLDLGGLGLTDSLATPYKFVFPAGTTLAAGGYLVLSADNASGGPYLHTGFTLKADGDDLSMFDAASRGGGLLDTVTFGVQVPDYSIGRRTDGSWGLCRPTFGGPNEATLTGPTDTLRINEWLADAQFVARNDFVELYNPDPLPVALGGLGLTDAAGSPARHLIPPLSYIAGNGFVDFIADSSPGQGADHLNFKLSPEVGLIQLNTPDGVPIDTITYGPQRTDVSQGRTPNGSETLTVFAQPTPGGGNPGAGGGGTNISTVTVPLLSLGATWHYNQTDNLDGTAWYATAYNDTAWKSGPALLGVEDCGCLPTPGLKTTLTIGRMTYYFRTHFVVDTNLDGFRLNLTTVLDDGAIVYLNGVRLLTNGMSTGAPAYATAASRNVGNAVAEYFSVATTALRQGTNVIAVEVHQTGSGSSDVVWGLGIEASRSVTNDLPGLVVPVVLNEVLAASRHAGSFLGLPVDYVELFNPATNDVDLAGLSLTDDPAFSRKWVFPAGASIPAGGHRVVYCTPDQPAGPENTGFGLNAQGGAVFFFNAPERNGALIDAVYYGLQTPDFPIARQPDGGGAWTLGVPTPGTANVAAGLASVSGLRLNEWMADPASGGDWFELYNPGDQPVALGGLFLTDDLANPTQSPIPPLSFIGAGPDAWLTFVADGNPGGGADHVNFSLKKSGEALGVFAAGGTMIDGIKFGAQTTGVSEGRFPDGAAAVTRFPGTGSPGGSNFLPLPQVVINEVLTHTDPPLEDAVELFNPTAAPVALGGWYLSNARSDLKKYRIPDGTTLAPGAYVVVYETNFNTGPGAFTFNSAHGDTAILAQADAAGNLTGYRSEVSFGAAANGVSFGRVVTSAGVDFTALKARTFGKDQPASVEEFRQGHGLSNAGPLVGPVVIAEIMYSPGTGGVEDPDAEFLELQNISTGSVPLFDPAQPANTWRLGDAVDFEFPPGLSLAPGGRLVIVGFNPADPTLLASFQARYQVPTGVPIVGPWMGRLENNGEGLVLMRPDAVQLPPHPDAGYVPQIVVDRVVYSPRAPWPSADANGLSLQRIDVAAYGNEPLNWRAAAPTAGQANEGGIEDTDGDGLPDAWELQYFHTLDRDGSGDFDSDGASDRDEYLAGTRPNDATDALRVVASVNDTGTTLVFGAVAGRTYTVQYRGALTGNAWMRLQDVPAPAASGPITVLDPAMSEGQRYYRLVTPAQPTR